MIEKTSSSSLSKEKKLLSVQSVIAFTLFSLRCPSRWRRYIFNIYAWWTGQVILTMKLRALSPAACNWGKTLATSTIVHEPHARSLVIALTSFESSWRVSISCFATRCSRKTVFSNQRDTNEKRDHSPEIGFNVEYDSHRMQTVRKDMNRKKQTIVYYR